MDGERKWQTPIGPERKGKHRNGSGSNPSVVTNGKSLYALFKSGNLVCLNFSGKIIWQKDLSGYGKDTLYWDFGTSPILSSKHLIIALMRKGNSWLLAFDQTTGEVVWKKERNFQRIKSFEVNKMLSKPRRLNNSYYGFYEMALLIL